jgi:hypothetical protein
MRAGAWQRRIGGRLVTLTGLALPPEGTTPAARGARAKEPRDAASWRASRGCWELTLTWNKHTAHLDLQVQAPTRSAKRRRDEEQRRAPGRGKGAAR